jgi:hypothetical protein
MPIIKGVEVNEGDEVYRSAIIEAVSDLIDDNDFDESCIYPTKNQFIDALIEELESRRDKECSSVDNDIYTHSFSLSEEKLVEVNQMIMDERIDELEKIIKVLTDNISLAYSFMYDMKKRLLKLEDELKNKEQ